MNIAAQPPVQADQTIYLKDYQKPAFLVESIHLDIQVYDDHTIVDSTLVMKRQAAGELVLLGRDLELQSIQMNGQLLNADQYQLDSEQLVITDAPDQVILKIQVVIHPESNTQLEGLYKAGDLFVTQNEPEGAFLAGVLLSESTFRHQIEADIEPFRGLLLGLFFLGVGMSLDLSVVAQNWQLILSGVLAMMFAKALMIYIVARLTKSRHTEALDRALLMAQGGEFAFALFSTAVSAQVIDNTVKSNLTAIIVLSMVLTPILGIVFKRFTETKDQINLDNVNIAEGLSGSILMIGFGRFGQVTSQLLLARGVDVTIIDNDIDMIQNAEKFGFKIYYGDGCRLDILHASGAATAQAIVVCVDSKETTNRIVELVTHEFPLAKLLVRSYDREHSLYPLERKTSGFSPRI